MLKRLAKHLSVVLAVLMLIGTHGLLAADLSQCPLHTMQNVNQAMPIWWWKGAPATWDRSVYHMGDLALSKVLEKSGQHTEAQMYRKISQDWAEDKEWKIEEKTNPYTNPPSGESVEPEISEYEDFLTCGQVYTELLPNPPPASELDHIKEAVDRLIIPEPCPLSMKTWVDELFMVGPLFSQLGNLYTDSTYFDKMFTLYNHHKSSEGGEGLYDEDSDLWYRDRSFVNNPSASCPFTSQPGNNQTPNGEKLF